MDETKAINCESCTKSYTQSTLLRHIARSDTCKSYYGPRFLEMKKEKNRNKVYKHRRNMTKKEQKKESKKRRKLYAKSEEKKIKNRQT